MEGLLHRHVLMFGLIKPASKRGEKVNVEINEWRNFAKTLVDCANFCIDLQIHTEELKLIFLVLYLVQVIEHPILQIPNFNFPNLRWYKMTSYIGIFGCIWYWFKTFIWKKYSKCKQTKYLGLAKFGVWWSERDTCWLIRFWHMYQPKILCTQFQSCYWTLTKTIGTLNLPNIQFKKLYQTTVGGSENPVVPFT